MPTYFQRPENALKRANEFIDVGKKQRALDALYDVIKSRKHRTWQKIHEPIMVKYLELCVELKKSHIAKEGLYQYKNICQQVNIKSLEDVVRGYLQLAEEKTEAAREESQQAVVEIDDLDNVQTPENLLLSAVSSEDSQDRTDRVVLTPWVKFLWESYRQCLELLRNNSRVERLYHNTAQQAFKFCLKYNRKTEFRKLCDNLRAHLDHIHKHQNQTTAVNLNNADSQAMHLETRLVQLDSAIQMELWQEAYKAIEGIHGLMALSKKAPKAQLMANYYQKLALVFWKAGNLLFHATALFRLFHLSRELRKNITQEEIQKMSARVVLATLAVPMPPNRPEIDRLVETDENVIDKNHRLLSTLLGLPNPPSRTSLVKDLVRFGVVHHAPLQVQELYRWLEVEFHPLKLCGQVSQCFDFLCKWEECSDLKQYTPPIQDITVMRLLKEVAQVYQTIEFTRLLELVPFASAFSLENTVVEAVRRNNLQVRIDHRKRCLHFGSDLSVSQREESVDGPYLQGMPSDQIRMQLVSLHAGLTRCVTMVKPERSDRCHLRDQILSAYRLTASKEHRRVLERQEIIEARKQHLETLSNQKEEEERKQFEEKQQKLREAEEERMAREAQERAKARILREQDEMKKKVVMEKIEQLKKTELGARIFEGLEEEELGKMDPEEIFNRQMEQLDRERKELMAKLRKQERKIDHLERAKRLEELPLLQEAYEDFKKEDKRFWEEEEQERIKTLISEREYTLQHRDRIMRMEDDKNAFLEQLRSARQAVYKEKLKEFEKKMNEARAKKLAERRAKRKEERREEWLEERENEKLRKQEEEKQKVLEQKRKEEEERLAQLDKAEAKRQARMREIEEKERESERKAASDRMAATAAAAAASSTGPSASSRAREDDNWRSRRAGESADRDREASSKDEDKGDSAGPGPTPAPAASWREREQAKRESWLRKDGPPGDYPPPMPLRGTDDRRGGSDDRWRSSDDRFGSRDERPRAEDSRRDMDEDRQPQRGDDMDWRKGGGGGGFSSERDYGERRGYGPTRRPPPMSSERSGMDSRRDFGESRRGGLDRSDDTDRGRFDRGFDRQEDRRGGFDRSDDRRGGGLDRQDDSRRDQRGSDRFDDRRGGAGRFDQYEDGRRGGGMSTDSRRTARFGASDRFDDKRGGGFDKPEDRRGPLDDDKGFGRSVGSKRDDSDNWRSVAKPKETYSAPVRRSLVPPTVKKENAWGEKKDVKPTKPKEEADEDGWKVVRH